jgi:hypothetical protein
MNGLSEATRSDAKRREAQRSEAKRSEAKRSEANRTVSLSRYYIYYYINTLFVIETDEYIHVLHYILSLKQITETDLSVSSVVLSDQALSFIDR